MTSTDLNTYVTFGYLAVGVAFLVVYMMGSFAAKTRMVALGLFIFVFALHTASIGLRWIESYQMGVGHAPLSNLYESLVFFAWAIALALILARVKFKTDIIVLLGMPVVFLTMAYTFFQDPSIKPLIPALQSNWLIAHVITCFLGYAGFTVSFVAALLLLLTRGSKSVPQTSYRNGYSG